MPMEIAKLALQLDDQDQYGNSMFMALRSLYSRFGLRVFGVGFIGTQYKHAMWTGVYFATLPYFQRLTRYFLLCLLSGSVEVEEFQGLVSMIAGFLAGAVGALANRPGDTVRAIIQKRCFTSTGLIDGGGISGNIKVCIICIVRSHHINIFYDHIHYCLGVQRSVRRAIGVARAVCWDSYQDGQYGRCWSTYGVFYTIFRENIY